MQRDNYLSVVVVVWTSMFLLADLAGSSFSTLGRAVGLYSRGSIPATGNLRLCCEPCNNDAQYWARTHDPGIKSPMLIKASIVNEFSWSSLVYQTPEPNFRTSEDRYNIGNHLVPALKAGGDSRNTGLRRTKNLNRVILSVISTTLGLAQLALQQNRNT